MLDSSLENEIDVSGKFEGIVVEIARVELMTDCRQIHGLFHVGGVVQIFFWIHESSEKT